MAGAGHCRALASVWASSAVSDGAKAYAISIGVHTYQRSDNWRAGHLVSILWRGCGRHNDRNNALVCVAGDGVGIVFHTQVGRVGRAHWSGHNGGEDAHCQEVLENWG